jgi:hypothetical protein
MEILNSHCFDDVEYVMVFHIELDWMYDVRTDG